MFSSLDKLILYVTCAIVIGLSIDHYSFHHTKPKYEKSQRYNSYHTNVSKKPRLKYSKEVQEMRKEYNNE